MKNKLQFFVTLFMFAFTLNQGIAQHVLPTFNLTIKNIQSYPQPNGSDSLITFDIYCQHTNFGQSDPFEYASSQFGITYNKAIRQTGVLSVVKTGSDLPANIQNPTMQVDTASGQIKVSSNLPSAKTNYFINSVFPGTRIIGIRFRTSQSVWPMVPLNLRFILPGAPFPYYHTFFGYLMPYADTVDSELFPNRQAWITLSDTIANHYTVENGNFVLPVELSSFVSNVNKNNVILNWSTNKETNNQQFDIERSVAGSDQWTKSGTVTGNGNTNEIKNYTFSERAVTGQYNYRLKQIDYNGNYEYFNLSSEVVVGVPTDYSLSQNYPNPFNPTTKIDFELPEDAKVNLVVYDISGREVNSLVNEFKTAGYYTINFNAADLSSGIYFYMLRANDYSMTKKMMVVK